MYCLMCFAAWWHYTSISTTGTMLNHDTVMLCPAIMTQLCNGQQDVVYITRSYATWKYTAFPICIICATATFCAPDKSCFAWYSFLEEYFIKNTRIFRWLCSPPKVCSMDWFPLLMVWYIESLWSMWNESLIVIHYAWKIVILYPPVQVYL